MAFTNFDTKEINCKIIYFGPRGAGKTENLRSIYKNTAKEARSGLIELEESRGGTKFFDFLPVSMGHVKDFHLKLHLFTLPTNPLYESVNSVILKGVDGIVFVADSRVELMAENIQSLAETRRLLADEGYNFSDLARVVQYNKRDLQDLVPLDVMRHELNPSNLPDQKAIARDSMGTMETLQAMSKLVLKKIAP
ncbi:MAG: gliding-motility protein MglA [Deltaproteobacteria bacterium]|nr:gliding-motility protein MglA [Deltaproteobacteria bacterium]